jgi:hypothetical protein
MAAGVCLAAFRGLPSGVRCLPAGTVEMVSGADIRRKRIEGGMEQQSGLSVSHEAIYQAIYALPRGELRRDLIVSLRATSS